MSSPATGEVVLREVTDADLPILFAQQLDPEANRMAAFSAADPSDRDAFTARWARIRADASIPVRTILFEGRVAGSILRWRDPELEGPEVSYWIGRELWGKGIATRALALFLEELPERPLFARAAADNAGSLRVLQKCGFTRVGSSRGFAGARGEDVEEVVLELRRPA